jgi:ribosomal protein S18 acetylase RimI-like enzyme
VGGEPVGLALWFTTFSTFRGEPGLYLEDLFVKSEQRGRGIGKALLAAVAAFAVERGCGRVEWSVLKWNTGAVGFYRSLGAQILDELTTCRIEEEPLRRLAGMTGKDDRELFGRNPSDE